MNDKRTRTWCFTYNNYTPMDELRLKALDTKYLLYGREVGKQGTPHLQGMVWLPNTKTLSQFKSFMGANVHAEPTKDHDASVIYCKKDGNFYEQGKPPITPKQKGKEEKDRWATALELASTGNYKEIEPRIQFLYCRNIQFLHTQALQNKSLPDTEHKMLWFYGKTGTGKSRQARRDFPTAYLKMCNKWWDGYTDQETVIIEELGLNHSVLITHMKIWLDRYPFLAEIKNCVIKIRPKIIIVCSNYLPSQIWPTENDHMPIERRCQIVDFNIKPFAFERTFKLTPEPVTIHSTTKITEESEESDADVTYVGTTDVVYVGTTNSNAKDLPSKQNVPNPNIGFRTPLNLTRSQAIPGAPTKRCKTPKPKWTDESASQDTLELDASDSDADDEEDEEEEEAAAAKEYKLNWNRYNEDEDKNNTWEKFLKDLK